MIVNIEWVTDWRGKDGTRQQQSFRECFWLDCSSIWRKREKERHTDIHTDRQADIGSYRRRGFLLSELVANVWDMVTNIRSCIESPIFVLLRLLFWLLGLALSRRRRRRRLFIISIYRESPLHEAASCQLQFEKVAGGRVREKDAGGCSLFVQPFSFDPFVGWWWRWCRWSSTSTMGPFTQLICCSRKEAAPLRLNSSQALINPLSLFVSFFFSLSLNSLCTVCVCMCMCVCVCVCVRVCVCFIGFE